MKPIRARYPDLPYILLLFLVTAALFRPATGWIAQQTMAHEQLRQSFFLLLFAAVILWIDHRKKLTLRLEITQQSLGLLAGAFLMMAAGLFFHGAYLPLTALALALAAFVHLLFGDRGFKLSLPWLTGFAAFLLFVFLFHGLDWPLRRLAGVQAGQILAAFGNQVQLGELTRPEGMLLLKVNDRLYEVAGQCNGFGLISTSTILALLLVVSRLLPLWWKAGAIVLAFISGAIFNLLRILGIVGLAPFFPNHYDILHETLGLMALFGGLAFLWWLLGNVEKEDSDSEAEESPQNHSTVSANSP